MGNFLLGLLLGFVLGGAGIWYYLNPPPATPRAAGIEQDVDAASQRGEEAAEDSVERLRDKLDSYGLSAEDIREELSRTGAIVRRNAKELGAELKNAATDTRITASIKAKLVRDPELSAWNIAVSTTNRHVTLSGTVESPELIGKAMLYGLETEGVDRVTSTLEIDKRPTT
jgi:osmotically-inducible protein OsmY